MLKETFIELINNYTDSQLADKLWNEVETKYSGKKRYYHTLEHLENLLKHLNAVKEQINDWNTILFTMYYHDIIYNPLKKNDEEKSAELAETRMRTIGAPQSMIEKCKNQILATKKHLVSPESDTNYFTDADLSILGRSWDIYKIYAQNVRKEYSVYPDFVYNPGRKKVLAHFLQMERIYKTDYFFEKFEKQAKQNLQQESEGL
jgi:predicted metal-dependent HD superfamily phosphohydrolase